MTGYNIYFDVAALFVLVIIVFYFLIQKRIVTIHTRMFTVLVWMAVLSSFFDIITIYMYDYTAQFPLVFSYIINQVYMITFITTSAIYFWYILLSTKEKEKLSVWDKVRMTAPILVDYVLILTTPLTHWVFYFGESNGNSVAYLHGNGMIILYLIALLYMIMSLVQTIVYRQKLTKEQKFAVFFYTIAVCVSILMQILVEGLLIIQFAEALSILMVYLSLENPDSYLNKVLGIYNRQAFLKVTSRYISKNQPFSVLGIRIGGFEYINDTIGVGNGDYLLKSVIEYVEGIAPDMQIYHVRGVQFVLVSKNGAQQWKEIVHKIQELFFRPFSANGMEIPLSVRMCSLAFPYDADSLEEILDVLDYILKQNVQLKNSYEAYDREKILTGKRRERKILYILQQALKNDGFEVHYQPIYSTEKKCYTSAEALVRLKDTELGFISPEEFIPLAEKNGLILDIGEFVFRSVCKFMASEKIWEKGIEYIEVNLSVVQCMQEKMHGNLIKIMDECNLDYNRINLEITETSAIISSDTLQRNMKMLINKGVTFALDDYGMGYSNTATLINYPFHIVKLDKSIVWAALKDEKANCALKHSMRMIREMNMKIVAEGVESQRHIQLLSEIGCDYYQGYFYSKPLPQQEFLKAVDKMNNTAV